MQILPWSEEHYLDELAWLHADLPPAEREPLIAEGLACMARAKRESLSPTTDLAWLAREGASRVASVYFKPLAGRVITLGGVRAQVAPSCDQRSPKAARDLAQAQALAEVVAADMLRNLAVRLQKDGVRQIQAVINQADTTSEPLLVAAGFQQLTRVQHLARRINAVLPQGPATAELPENCYWRAADELSRVRMERLIEATFIDTLDCPMLNQLRPISEVLDGFLDSPQPFRCRRMWQVLLREGKPIGCLLLTKHPQTVVELAYMGLCPAARGRRLGALMLQRAIELSTAQGAHWLVAAVDENNTPALNHYHQAALSAHSTLSVWWYPPAVSSAQSSDR